MADMVKQISPEESYTLLRDKAQKDGDDFRIRIQRKRSAVGFAETIAYLAGASVEHLATPELWLAELTGGGGTYQLAAYHESDSVHQIGGLLVFTFQSGSAREVDPSVVGKPGWQGPKRILYPQPGGAYPAGGTTYIDTPPATPQLGAPQPSAGPAGVGPGALSSGQDGLSALWARLQAAEATIADRERRLMDRERQIELTAIRREQDTRMLALEARLAQAAPSASPGRNSIAETVTALAPILIEFQKGQNEMRLEMMKIQAGQQAENAKMLTALLNRPTVDPAIQAMIEKAQAREGGRQVSPDALMKMADAVTGMSMKMIDMTQKVAEANAGPGEPSIVTAVREVSKGLKSIVEASRPQAVPWAGPPQAALPTGQQPFTLMDRLEHAIRSKANPADVAAGFVEGVRSGDGSIRQALVEASGSPNEMFSRRLGMAWFNADPGNPAYAAALLGEVTKQGIAAGILQMSPEEIAAAQATMAGSGGGENGNGAAGAEAPEDEDGEDTAPDAEGEEEAEATDR